MKIVVSGKGGVGKTTLSGTIGLLLAAEGKQVLAVDSDPSMNLHLALGMDNPTPIVELKELISERTVMETGIFRLNPKVDDIPERFSSKRDGLSLIVMGTVEKGGEGCICPETAFLKALLRHLVLKKDEFLVLDTEAGVEHLGRNIAEKFDLMMIVIEPSVKAVETANRIYELSKEIGIKRIVGVANKVSSKAQEDFIHGSLAFELAVSIPYDQRIVEADMEKAPLYEFQETPAFRKIKALADRYIN